MKRKLLLVVLSVTALFFVGCARQEGLVTTPLQCDENTPPGVQCIGDYSGKTWANNGKVLRVTFVAGGICKTKTEAPNGTISITEGPCPTKVTQQALVDDRFNVGFKTIGPGVGDGLGSIPNTLINADAIKYSAKQKRLASENAGPSEITYNITSSGASAGSSSNPAILNYNDNESAALSQQSTGVGVSTNQETGSSCASGKCYDPTK